MLVKDLFNSKAIGSAYTEVASNKIPYLGVGFFPSTFKMGTDLKQIRSAKGLPVALQPSAYDTVSTIRSREGMQILDTQLAYFKESMLLKEQDELDIENLRDSADPYAEEVINRIYDSQIPLVEGADVIPEIMRMQLLSNENGHPSISISANGATYEYNYDPDNTYSANNYVALSGTSTWDDVDHADPIADMEAGKNAVYEQTGTYPKFALMSANTFKLIKKNKNIKNGILSQNIVTVPYLTDAIVKSYIADTLEIQVIVYDKKYKNYQGVATNFYPDGMCTLLPEGALGKTYYANTPEMRTKRMNKEADVTVVNTGVTVTVSTSTDPVQTKTTVSETVLPSFERMLETYTIKAYTPA